MKACECRCCSMCVIKTRVALFYVFYSRCRICSFRLKHWFHANFCIQSGFLYMVGARIWGQIWPDIGPEFWPGFWSGFWLGNWLATRRPTGQNKIIGGYTIDRFFELILHIKRSKCLKQLPWTIFPPAPVPPPLTWPILCFFRGVLLLNLEFPFWARWPSSGQNAA